MAQQLIKSGSILVYSPRRMVREAEDGTGVKKKILPTCRRPQVATDQGNVPAIAKLASMFRLGPNAT